WPEPLPGPVSLLSRSLPSRFRNLLNQPRTRDHTDGVRRTVEAACPPGSASVSASGSEPAAQGSRPPHSRRGPKGCDGFMSFPVVTASIAGRLDSEISCGPSSRERAASANHTPDLPGGTQEIAGTRGEREPRTRSSGLFRLVALWARRQGRAAVVVHRAPTRATPVLRAVDRHNDPAPHHDGKEVALPAKGTCSCRRVSAPCCAWRVVGSLASRTARPRPSIIPLIVARGVSQRRDADVDVSFAHQGVERTRGFLLGDWSHEQPALSPRLHADRAAGGHRHHCHPDRAL